MSLSAIVRVVAIACAGVLSGVYFGYWAGPQDAVHALSDSAFVQYQQVVHVHYVRFMPVLVVGALAGALVWLITLRTAWRSPEFWLVAASVGAVAAIAVLTRAVNVPLNNLLMTWSVAAPPPDLRRIWAPWEQVNTARAVLSIGAVLLEAIALNLRRDHA